MKVIRYIYTGYGLTVFILGFILLMPFFLVLIQVKSWHKYAIILNNLWAKWIFVMMGLPIQVDYRSKLSPKQRYVFCPNHFSYLDIPLCGLIRHPFIFVGKNSMERIPVFGYMYRKIHITVDRESMKSKYNTFVRAKEAIDKGLSLLIFPEGGIKSTRPPDLALFKEGAFRVAIEKQIPVVPVTIPYNWIILPDNENLFRWGRLKLICHEPVPTAGLSIDEMDELKMRVYAVIQKELNEHFPTRQTEMITR